MLYLQNFFEITALEHPNSIAVDDHGKKTTYKNLDFKANKLANLLLTLNIKVNERICILTKKNINLYISILATLKSGGCWVPLTDQFPEKRIKFIIDTTVPKAIIIEKEFYFLVKKYKKKIKIIIIDEKIKSNKYLNLSDISKQKKNKPIIKDANLSSLAYIIYTSGSTGEPKGVMVTHLNTSTYITNSKKYFTAKPKMRFAHVAEIIFDPSIFDIFICWHNNGTIVPMNKNEYKVNFLKFFEKNKNINILFIVPSFFEKLSDLNMLKSKSLKNLKHVIFGGERLSKKLVKDSLYSLPKCNFYNVYGTTEASIISHWHKINKRDLKFDSMPVGKELPGINTILLKNNNEESKINENGDAHFYGSQVSIGYWNDNFMNKKYFKENPTKKPIFEKIYNTGDILYKNKEGLYFYKGRQDSQIKLRGHRIELHEIENVFKSNYSCKDIKVLSFSRNNSTYYSDLIFYIRRSEKLKKSKNFYYSTSRKLLPKYMQPTNIFLYDKDFPRNINGKINIDELKKQFIKYIA